MQTRRSLGKIKSYEDNHEKREDLSNSTDVDEK